MRFFWCFFPLWLSCFFDSSGSVYVGIDLLLEKPYLHLLEGKRIGLITNHTAVNSEAVPTAECLKEKMPSLKGEIVAFFCPEHGLYGERYAEEGVVDAHDPDGIPIYSLHGTRRRPTKEMLQNIDLLIYDIQDIGSRSYTYLTTLLYVMEEAAKANIPVIVLDRPNPLNGNVVDGPMLEEKWRSFVGYLNIPYVHGMTTGEVAQLFNAEYRVGCSLRVIPMKGWHRNMTFLDTGLPWIPTSPHIPDVQTPLYYPMTGILGELQIVNIGVGYTLPFRVVGAPWIEADRFAAALNQQNYPGIHFFPYHFKPFFGRYAHEVCHGVLLHVTDPLRYRPVQVAFLLIGMLKSLYPQPFKQALQNAQNRKQMFCQVIGSEAVYETMRTEPYIVWKLRGFDQEAREAFFATRQKYLIYR